MIETYKQMMTRFKKRAQRRIIIKASGMGKGKQKTTYKDRNLKFNKG